MLGEMSKDRASDAHRCGAFLDGHAKVIAHPHREGVEIDRWLLPLHFGSRKRGIAGASRLAARNLAVPVGAPGHFVSTRPAQMVAAPAVSSHVGGLVLTGGDVAAAVSTALGTTALWLEGETTPGIPRGVLEGVACTTVGSQLRRGALVELMRSAPVSTT
jgi:hypothetical protein